MPRLPLQSVMPVSVSKLDIRSHDDDRSLSYAPPSSPHTAPMLGVLPSLH